MVTVGVEGSSGVRIGEINMVSNSLAAGQSVTLSGPGATGVAAQNATAGSIVCKVASVARFPS